MEHILRSFTELLTGTIMPPLLILCGIILAVMIKLPRIIAPRRFFKTLSDAGTSKENSPFGALCTALAGTLGVGNIAGVSTAITAGGPGAIFWMWIGAVFSMSIKYSEVALALRYRQHTDGAYIGGAMYTMRYGCAKFIGRKGALIFGGIFSLMCIGNSLITGNIVQANSAAAVFENIPPHLTGFILAAALALVALFASSGISKVTSALIPPLSAVYIALSLFIIIKNATLLPGVIKDIFSSALSPAALFGGIAGGGIQNAVRLGITRGIFSNEAGCGTAPSAHASAEVKSPHHQGCFGIFEVMADTLILCSMTAFVILIHREKSPASTLDGVPLALEAFSSLIGKWAGIVIGISVVLFAFATMTAQLYYGSVAVRYFSDSKIAPLIYTVAAVFAAFFGSATSPEAMWLAADLIVGSMTVINTTVLIFLRRECAEEASRAKK